MLTFWEILNLLIALIQIGGATLLIYLNRRQSDRWAWITGGMIYVLAIIYLIQNVPDSGIQLSAVSQVRLTISVYMGLLAIHFLFHTPNITDRYNGRWILLLVGLGLLVVIVWMGQVIASDPPNNGTEIQPILIIASVLLGILLVMNLLEWKLSLPMDRTQMVLGMLLLLALLFVLMLPNATFAIDGLLLLVFVAMSVMNTPQTPPSNIESEPTDLLKRTQHDLRQVRLALTDAKTEIVELSKTLEVTNHFKRDFLSNMSHELRTPLNAVIGYCDLLRDEVYGEINEKQADRLDRVLENANHLLRIISDILDLNQLDTSKTYLQVEALRLGILVEHVLNIYEQDIAEKELQVTIESEPLPLVFGDQAQVNRIFDNLISNAVKFTEKGEIRVELRHTRITAGESESNQIALPAKGWLRDGDWVIVRISDTGIGVSPENQASIFDAFVQADSGLARIHGGTGVGLTIVKKLIDLHNGSLWLTSTPGEGSAFSVAFPSESSPEDQ